MQIRLNSFDFARKMMKSKSGRHQHILSKNICLDGKYGKAICFYTSDATVSDHFKRLCAFRAIDSEGEEYKAVFERDELKEFIIQCQSLLDITEGD